ncbi:MAG: ribosome recycling factor [bacterium]|nr:ribosome recycling factor [bacterium]
MLDIIYRTTKERMQKTISVLSDELKTIRSGKASASLVENLQVDYYGNKTPLKQIASIASPENRLLIIQPWDKTALIDIEKAILSSELGVTPNNDGKIIRLAFPSLNEEQRKNISKVVHKMGEESKVSIRNIRRDQIHEIEKSLEGKKMSEDDAEKGKKELQKFTDDYIKKIDDILKAKIAEIMEI